MRTIQWVEPLYLTQKSEYGLSLSARTALIGFFPAIAALPLTAYGPWDTHFSDYWKHVDPIPCPWDAMAYIDETESDEKTGREPVKATMIADVVLDEVLSIDLTIRNWFLEQTIRVWRTAHDVHVLYTIPRPTERAKALDFEGLLSEQKRAIIDAQHAWLLPVLGTYPLRYVLSELEYRFMRSIGYEWKRVACFNKDQKIEFCYDERETHSVVVAVEKPYEQTLLVRGNRRV